MSKADPFARFATLRATYPEDVERIEQDERALRELLERKEYAQLLETKKLIALCRTGIVTARVKLATDRALTTEQRAELWAIIDAREWFLKMVTGDFDGEIAAIEHELEAELSR